MNTFRRLLLALVASLSIIGIVPSSASAASSNVADERDEIRDWYASVYIYNPDVAGMNYWVNRFDSHNDIGCSNGQPNFSTANRAAVSHDMRSFYAGTQVMTSTNNLTRVIVAYRGVLDRAPDTAGRTYWLNRLNNGTSWQTMVHTMVYSNEYMNNRIQQTQRGKRAFDWQC